MDSRQQLRPDNARTQAAVAQPAPAASRPATSFTPQQPTGGRSSKLRKLWWLPVLLVALVAAAWLYMNTAGGSQVDSGKYQAVFLNNGQVYFGKLHGYYTERPYLSDVYYIQAEDGTAADANKESTNTQKLIKLGKEIHGPENELILNKTAILFVENLTDGSSVVKAIKSENK